MFLANFDIKWYEWNKNKYGAVHVLSPREQLVFFCIFPTIMVYISFENSQHRRYLCLTWHFLSMKWLPFDGLGQIRKFANLQMHLNLHDLKTHTANGKRLTSNCSLRFAVNVDLKVSIISDQPKV